MIRNYLEILSDTIHSNWSEIALYDYSEFDENHGNRYTYGELHSKIKWLCYRFFQYGLRKGDHIAICGENSANWAVAYLSVAAFHGVSVTVLNTQTIDNISTQIAFADSKAIIVDDDIWIDLHNKYPEQNYLVFSLHDFSTLSCLTGTTNNNSDTLDEYCSFSGPIDELAQICFTSGSVNRPKGVMLSYRSLSANVTYNYALFSKYKSKNSVVILPSAHIYGLVLELLQPLCVGTHIHILQYWTINSLPAMLSRIRPSIIMFVPYIFQSFINHVSANLKDTKNLRNHILTSLGGEIDLISIGGASLPPSFERLLLELHLPIALGYGMTECGPRISISLCGETRIGSVGKIVPTLEAKIVDCEILVKGDNVMLGYYKDKEATSNKINESGWLRTGDIGSFDKDGYLYITGRKEQDFIVLPSGEKIRPQNIENILNSDAHIIESLVVSKEGKLAALVYTKDQLDIFELIAKVNSQLPIYSQLSTIEIVQEPFQKTEKQTIKRYLYS